MNRVPLGRAIKDPRVSNNFLDTCAFDPKFPPEDKIAIDILNIYLNQRNSIVLLITSSNLNEIMHPNTPSEVKDLERGNESYS
ncbi:hypothetical protein [Hahella chejuensis]|uniref:hypothetical protein n=1 Tax=Hahella chejuensis TaxID=158327 RepID=UPI0011D0C395|nr:hypothetical protein [Hahella chejuensis]